MQLPQTIELRRIRVLTTRQKLHDQVRVVANQFFEIVHFVF